MATSEAGPLTPVAGAPAGRRFRRAQTRPAVRRLPRRACTSAVPPRCCRWRYVRRRALTGSRVLRHQAVAARAWKQVLAPPSPPRRAARARKQFLALPSPPRQVARARKQVLAPPSPPRRAARARKQFLAAPSPPRRAARAWKQVLAPPSPPRRATLAPIP